MKFDHKHKLLLVGITSPKHGIVKLKKNRAIYCLSGPTFRSEEMVAPYF